LSDEQEMDDCVGPYGRSQLWLVSRDFEDKRDTPILGMNAYLKTAASIRNSVGDIVMSAAKGKPGAEIAATSHGGFDNDPFTLNSILYRILGGMPASAFTQRDLNY
jgi:hypothetical protein